MSSSNKEFCFFLSKMYTFCFFSSFSALARISNFDANISIKSAYPCHVLSLKEYSIHDYLIGCEV